MARWQRVKSACEWGFFFGIVSWLLATGITNKIPAVGVWGIILSRTLMGFIIGIFKWEFLWWARGLILGAVLNLPLGLVAMQFGFGWDTGFWPTLVSGMIFAMLIEWILKKKQNPSERSVRN